MVIQTSNIRSLPRSRRRGGARLDAVLMAKKQASGPRRDLNKSTMDIPKRMQDWKHRPDHAMILPCDAIPGPDGIFERTPHPRRGIHAGRARVFGLVETIIYCCIALRSHPRRSTVEGPCEFSSFAHEGGKRNVGPAYRIGHRAIRRTRLRRRYDPRSGTWRAYEHFFDQVSFRRQRGALPCGA